MNRPSDWILPRVRRMHGYVPGAQPERPDIIKLNTNENPFPCPEAVRAAIRAELDRDLLQRYPNPRSDPLREALARAYGRDANSFLAGNGSDEILAIVFRALLEPARTVIFPDPSYGLYPTLAEITGAAMVQVPVQEDWALDLSGLRAAALEHKAPLTVITNPNAPTGIAQSAEDLLAFARANPGLTLVDEAYIEFGGQSVASFAGTPEYPRLLVSNTMSKSYSLAGMRLGWLLAHPDLIQEFDKVRDSYNLSRLAQAAALAALADSSEMKGRAREVIAIRDSFRKDLVRLGFETLDSRANFVFTRPPQHTGTARQLFAFLDQRGIIVRFFDRPRLCDFVRITIGTRAQMETLTTALDDFVSGEQ